ncbi:MAG: putative lipid II flippase FtsW [Thermodesulfobacteriota bacterium]|nr:putative lipid II flippase FtsW [Thermodesulfobacteriota bacterium]
MRKKTDEIKEIDFDVFFLMITAALVILGTVMVFSSSFFVSKELTGSGLYMIKRHLFHLALGVIVMAVFMKLDYRRLNSTPLVLFLVMTGFVALCMCFVPGIGIIGGHAKRWVGLGPLTFQSSELVKIVLIIFMAYFLSKKDTSIKDFKTGVMPVLFIVMTGCLLILVEPDFGTAAAIGLWAMIILFVAGMRFVHIAALATVALPVSTLVMIMEPYRRNRLLAFMDPWSDRNATGYQAIQSMIAFAKGGITGSGLGEGTQKLLFLPAPHTDFILSALGEELGFIGIITVISLFGVWIWRGISIAMRTNDAFGFYLVIAAVSLIGLQAVINMGVAMSILPTTGIALPFFSYGGSTLLCSMVASGIILSVSRRAQI